MSPSQISRIPGLTCVVIWLALSILSAAQDSTPQIPATVASPDQDNSQTESVQNPPLTGLDQPTQEPGFGSRSFLLLGAHASESLYADSENSNLNYRSITRALGSAELKKTWKHYQSELSYVGGDDFNHGLQSDSQIQALDTEQRIQWKKTQLQFRDLFSYLPEGEFGFSAFGGTGAYQLSGLGGFLGGNQVAGGLFSAGQFGSVGEEPRINNISALELHEFVTPRSSFTETGAFVLSHFTDSSQGLIDSQEVVGEVGYDYQLNRRDQLAVMYAYQTLRFPLLAGGNLQVDLVHFLYGHRVTGRMDLVLGAGPQFIFIHQPAGQTSTVTISPKATLVYKFPKTRVSASYLRYITPGSGFYAGADSNVARATVERPIGRSWELLGDSGYVHNSRLLSDFSLITTRTYQVVYAGIALRRSFSRYFDLFGGYQLNDLVANSCTPAFLCQTLGRGNIITGGIDWQFRPIRLD